MNEKELHIKLEAAEETIDALRRRLQRVEGGSGTRFHQQLQAYQIRIEEEAIKLQESQSWSNILMGNAMDAIVGIDQKGLITHWNSKAEAIFGWEKSDIVGKPLADMLVLDTEDMSHYLTVDRENMIQGRIMEGSARLRDASELPVELTISPLKLQSGNFLVVIIRDISDRKRAEQSLKNTNESLEQLVKERTKAVEKSEERFALAMKGANDGLWDWNLETDEVYYSPRWKSMLGYHEDELGSTIDTWSTLVHPDDKERVFETAQNYLEGRTTSFEVEMRMHHKDGHEVIVLSRAFLAHKDSSQQATRLIGTHVDITERKKAESHIKQTSRILEMIAKGESAQAIYDAIAALYESRHTGLRCSILELKGNRLVYGGAPSLPKEYCEAVNGLENGPNVGSYGISTYTGKRMLVENIEADPKWAEINHTALPHGMRCCWSEPIKDATGNVLGAFGMYYDHPALPNEYELADLESAARLAGIIMARDRREASLRKLSQAIEQAGESVMITDTKGTIEYVNPSFTKMTGYSAEEVLGKNPRILKSGNQTPEYYEQLWATITSGKIWSSTIVDRRKDGSQYPAIMSISPIFNADKITHYVGIQQDMTDQESAEEKFRQAQKMEALGTLVGGIAHDFNNILAGMSGNLYLAKLHTQDLPDVFQKLTNVEQLSNQAAELIRQLLTFARKDRVSMENIALLSTFKEAFKFLRTSTPENIDMHQDFGLDPLQINGDATQLHQVLMNLVNNSRDALEDVQNPRITIKLEAFYADDAFVKSHTYFNTGHYACLSVEDNGRGIPERDIAHLFEPFFTTKEVGKGTGLGLAMVFGAIKRHHGYIEVQSTEGVGSIFTVYIPLLETNETPYSSPKEKGMTIEKGRGETILLVDDDSHILEMGKEVLETIGYRVLEASNGLEAIDMFTAHMDEISLIITDVVMPRLGGVQAVEDIRKIRPNIKVIYSTGYDKNTTMSDIISSTESVTLSKPYNVEKLSQLIRSQLNS